MVVVPEIENLSRRHVLSSEVQPQPGLLRLRYDVASSILSFSLSLFVTRSCAARAAPLRTELREKSDFSFPSQPMTPSKSLTSPHKEKPRFRRASPSVERITVAGGAPPIYLGRAMFVQEMSEAVGSARARRIGRFEDRSLGLRLLRDH